MIIFSIIFCYAESEKHVIRKPRIVGSIPVSGVNFLRDVLSRTFCLIDIRLSPLIQSKSGRLIIDVCKSTYMNKSHVKQSNLDALGSTEWQLIHLHIFFNQLTRMRTKLLNLAS